MYTQVWRRSIGSDMTEQPTVSGKEPAAGDLRAKRSIPGLTIPWRRGWQPTPVFLPEESHAQRNLAGFGPWGRTGSDTTEATHCKHRERGESSPTLDKTKVLLKEHLWKLEITL